MTEHSPSRKQNLEPIADLIDGVVASLGERAGLGRGAAIWAQWAEIAGDEWADTVPLKLEEGVLAVGVSGGISATRLRYATGGLLARITECVGPDVVTSIRVQIRRDRRVR